jgi:hypothetical protein
MILPIFSNISPPPDHNIDPGLINSNVILPITWLKSGGSKSREKKIGAKQLGTRQGCQMVYIFIPNLSILVHFERPRDGNVWCVSTLSGIYIAILYILWPFGIFGGQFGIFFPNWFVAPRKIWQPWNAAIPAVTRVARWHTFKPKIPNWVNFGGSCNGRCRHILWPFGIFCSNVANFTVVWYIFPVLVCCTKKYLAALAVTF